MSTVCRGENGDSPRCDFPVTLHHSPPLEPQERAFFSMQESADGVSSSVEIESAASKSLLAQLTTLIYLRVVFAVLLAPSLQC